MFCVFFVFSLFCVRTSGDRVYRDAWSRVFRGVFASLRCLELQEGGRSVFHAVLLAILAAACGLVADERSFYFCGSAQSQPQCLSRSAHRDALRPLPPGSKRKLAQVERCNSGPRSLFRRPRDVALFCAPARLSLRRTWRLEGRNFQVPRARRDRSGGFRLLWTRRPRRRRTQASATPGELGNAPHKMLVDMRIAVLFKWEASVPGMMQ